MAPRVDVDRLRSVLIVKMSSIGDVVHALPVATALRRRFPQLRISWAVEERAAPLLADHPAIDRVVVFPPMRWGEVGPAWTRAVARAVRDLTSEAYDVCLDLQGLAKSSLVALLSRAPLRLGTWNQRISVAGSSNCCARGAFYSRILVGSFKSRPCLFLLYDCCGVQCLW